MAQSLLYPDHRANSGCIRCRLWSRLILHFWALEVEKEVNNASDPDPVEYLQRAYEETKRATTTPNEWYGTTTSATALLHWTAHDGCSRPLLYVTNLGDCKIVVIRPREAKVLFRTEEQWHWFDCPMQLGTNSVDTPRKNAVVSKVDLEENDVVLALSDGVIDNLWEHEVVTVTLDSMKKWDEKHPDGRSTGNRYDEADERMVYVAMELLKAAHTIAQDPFAESPFMEKAIDEGLAIEGGQSAVSRTVILTALQPTDVATCQAKWTISASSLRFARNEMAERPIAELHFH